MTPCCIEYQGNGYGVSGAINFASVSNLYQQGKLLIESNPRVLLDFRRVTGVDSSAIALLINWVRLAKQQQASVLFLNLPTALVEMACVCDVMAFLAPYTQETGSACSTKYQANQQKT